MTPLSTTNPREENAMTTTLQALDWPRLLLTPDTRWYLDRGLGDIAVDQCIWQQTCYAPVIAFVEYRVPALPRDPHETGFDAAELVCSKHLSDFIEYITGGPLVAGTVVEVGVDPAFLRLTGVDPSVVERFNDHSMGCGQ